MPLGVFLTLVLSQWWATWYPGAEPGGGGYIVQRMASFAIGRPVESDTPWAQALTKNFGSKGYRLPELMRDVALSDDFYKVTPPDAAPAKAAANPAPTSASR